MSRRLPAAVAALCCVLCAAAADPVLEVGTQATTHVVFASDLSYVDVSRRDAVVAAVVDASRNMLALKARAPFGYETTVSALESNGSMHTFRVRFSESPSELVVDVRPGAALSGSVNTQQRPSADSLPAHASLDVAAGGSAGNFGRGDAPTLQEVTAMEQHVFDVADRSYRILAVCTNVFVYSDVLYLTVRLENRSDIGYEAGDAQFTVEDVRSRGGSLSTEKTVSMRSSYGTLSCPPRSVTVVGYTIPKMTLLRGEGLRIYIYEKGGTRNLVLTLTDRDVNYAVQPDIAGGR